ncbi:1,4-alpha-glucan branching enzyme [Gammaproteobacteria bacterium]
MNDNISDAVRRILEARHHDPFAVLGLHLHGMGEEEVVRVFLPRAASVELLNGIEVLSMTRQHDTDLFEWYGARGQLTPHYQVRWCDQEGRLHTQHDPYCLPPQVPDFDLHLFGEGHHWHAYRFFGAHPWAVEGIEGVLFATWAPNAARVSVVGDFNRWDGRVHPMRARGGSGVWELFVPGLKAGTLYKFEIRNREQGSLHLKSDPYAQQFELRPATACVVAAPSHYAWEDAEWLARRPEERWRHGPVSIYEMHLGSWQHDVNGHFLNYRELAHRVVKHVVALGFTHVELLPITEYPFDGSWGYQSLGYFAPTSRFGSPDDFRYFVDYCHSYGLGVILDWVPAHFPKDPHGLARFDGTPLYEHEDPRLGEHRDWGTLIFNYGRKEVRNFLLASALYWIEEFHLDGLRVDAVASMLYLDYSRGPGEWLPNRHGGRENLEAIEFLREVNTMLHGAHPGVMVIAEESTAWPMVSRPTWLGGLGFTLKWNMGWMHDTLNYFSQDPIYRHYHHQNLTFGLLYAFTENFLLPLSHDEVVHGKGSLFTKMPGDTWQRFANLRLLYTWIYTHPGKKLLFMGAEFGQIREWNHDGTLDWTLLEDPHHRGVMTLLTDLNHLYRDTSALHRYDFDGEGFEWIDCYDAAQSVVIFLRRDGERCVVVVINFTPVVRYGYRVGVPLRGIYHEVFNSDATCYGGSGVGNCGSVTTEDFSWMGRPYSLNLNLPPLGALLLVPPVYIVAPENRTVV